MPHPIRRLVLRATALVLAGALAGCTMPGSADALRTGATSAHASLGTEPSLLVATTRMPAQNPSIAPFFGPERGRGLSFATATLVPERGLMGREDRQEVAAVGQVVTREAADAFAQAALGKDVLLYVHGFRETFETAAAGAGELATGIGFSGVPGIFTWPSGGATLAYGYDRESALWSRDALETLLLTLARSQSGGRIHIVAHSMGSLLTLESLRFVRASGGDQAMARIGAVVLASPDVDIDLFEQAVEKLGVDARKITVITSQNDRALAISGRLAGGVVRAGAAGREKLQALGVTVADASEFGGGLFNHDLFLRQPDVRAVVARAIERAR